MFRSYDILTRYRAWLWRAALLIVLCSHLMGITNEFYSDQELTARLVARTWTETTPLYSGVADGRAPLLIALHKPWASETLVSTIGLRVQTLLWALGALFAFHLLAIRLIGKRGASAASLSFALITIGWPLTAGVSASGPLFGALPALIALLVMLQQLETKQEPYRFMLPGALIGLAMLFDGSYILLLVLGLAMTLRYQGRAKGSGVPLQILGTLAGTIALLALAMLATPRLIDWGELFRSGSALRTLADPAHPVLGSLARLWRLFAGAVLVPLPWLLGLVGGWGLMRLSVMIPSGEPVTLRPAGLRLILFIWLIWGLAINVVGHPEGGAALYFYAPPLALLAGLGMLRLTGGRLLSPGSRFDMNALGIAVLNLTLWTMVFYVAHFGFSALYRVDRDERVRIAELAETIDLQAEGGTVFIWADDPLLLWRMSSRPATRFLNPKLMQRDPEASVLHGRRGRMLNLLRRQCKADLNTAETEGRAPAVVLDATEAPPPDMPQHVVAFPDALGNTLEHWFNDRYMRALTTSEGYPLYKPMTELESRLMPEFEEEH